MLLSHVENLIAQSRWKPLATYTVGSCRNTSPRKSFRMWSCVGYGYFEHNIVDVRQAYTHTHAAVRTYGCVVQNVYKLISSCLPANGLLCSHRTQMKRSVECSIAYEIVNASTACYVYAYKQTKPTE